MNNSRLSNARRETRTALTLVLGVGTMVAGCGISNSYVPAPADKAARIRFAGPQTSAVPVQVRGYPSGTCVAPVNLGVLTGLPSTDPAPAPVIPGSEEYREGSQFERLVPGGIPYLFTMRGAYGTGNMNSWCAVTARFVPKLGEQYEAKFDWGGERCTIELRTIKQAVGGAVVRQREPSVTRAGVCEAGLW